MTCLSRSAVSSGLVIANSLAALREPPPPPPMSYIGAAPTRTVACRDEPEVYRGESVQRL